MAEVTVLTVRIPTKQALHLKKLARDRGITRSDLVRAQLSALERYALVKK